MLRCNAFTRVAAGAVQASSSKHVAHLTRTINHLSLTLKLASVSGPSTPIARSFATKIVKKKPATKAKAKKPVKKKTPAKPAAKAKAKAKTPAAKKKKAPVRKKVVKKKVIAKPKKRVPTELQKAKAVKAKALDEVTNLKKTALVVNPPKHLAETAWTVFVAEKSKGTKGLATEFIKTLSAGYKALTASELEHYNHIANQNKAANEKAYKAWVNSHTPEQIRVANSARALLKRRAIAGAPGTRKNMKGLNKIRDERQPKRLQSAYITFSVERIASGDFKNVKLSESAKVIKDEWKALGPAELKKYSDLQAADKARYIREYQSAYGHPSPVAASTARISP